MLLLLLRLLLCAEWTITIRTREVDEVETAQLHTQYTHETLKLISFSVSVALASSRPQATTSIRIAKIAGKHTYTLTVVISAQCSNHSAQPYRQLVSSLRNTRAPFISSPRIEVMWALWVCANVRRLHKMHRACINTFVCVHRGTSVRCASAKARAHTSIQHTILPFQLLFYSFLYFVSPFSRIIWILFVLRSACGHRVHNVRDSHSQHPFNDDDILFYSFPFFCFSANFESNSQND